MQGLRGNREAGTAKCAAHRERQARKYGQPQQELGNASTHLRFSGVALPRASRCWRIRATAAAVKRLI